MSVREITEKERIKHYYDQGNDCLAIDITGLDLEKGGCLWVWAYKPKPGLAGHAVYSYPSSPDANDCTSSNSRLTELAGELEHKRDDKEDSERIWIPLQVPDDLYSVRYLLLRTDRLDDVSGWGWKDVPVSSTPEKYFKDEKNDSAGGIDPVK